MTPEQCVRLTHQLISNISVEPTPVELANVLGLIYGMTSSCIELLWLAQSAQDQLPN